MKSCVISERDLRIRELRDQLVTCKEIAEQFGISEQRVSQIDHEVGRKRRQASEATDQPWTHHHETDENGGVIGFYRW